MRALVYVGPEALDLQDIPEPDGDGETVVRVTACGICGSDIHAYRGHDGRRPAPLVLGHEAVGVTQDGRSVVVNPLVTCGACPGCRAGRTNLCIHRQIISMAPRPGAFAELIRLPERNLLPLPDGLAAATAALTEPLACGWHAVRLALRHGTVPLADQDGDGRPVVLGGGAIGLAAALALAAHGAQRVRVVEPNRARWDAIAGAGPFDPATPGESAAPHLVIDAYGAGATRAAASEMVRPGGTIVHVGLADGGPGLDTRRATLQEIAFVGAYTYTAAEFAETLAAMAAGTLGPLDWFEIRPLDAGPSAFAEIATGRVAAPKIMLAP